jgi:hypothetical protein
MAIESSASSSTTAASKSQQAGSAAQRAGSKETISPAERWLKVRENAYLRAQRRGFVGCNTYKDWLDAEEEIDANYTTDFRGVFSLSDPEEVTEQIKSVLAGYGLGDLSVDALLTKHREGMENLASVNKVLLDGTSELAKAQTTLVQDALSEAAKTLQSVARGGLGTEGVTKQAELSIKAVENTLSLMRSLTEAVTGKPAGNDKDPSDTKPN